MALISGAIALAGLAVGAVGAIGSMSAASDAAAAQGNISAANAKIEAQKMQAMELDARRRQMEVFRNAQRARSVALTNATNQGAQFGSGLQGGYGQIGGESGNNLLGINQSLDIGRAIGGLNQYISGQNGQLAQAQASSQFYSGLSSLGGSMVTNAGTIGNLTSGWGSGMSGGGSVSMGLQPYGSMATGSRY